MAEFHGPKYQEMRFPAFSFQNFSRGACPLKQWAKHYRMGPLDPQTVTFKKALAT